MKRLHNYFYLSLFLVWPFITGCTHDDAPEMPQAEEAERVLLVYAINNSSLMYDFNDDSKEMLEAMQGINSDKYPLLIFKTESDKQNCGLYTVKKNNAGSAEFVKVKQYPRQYTSTHPDRIKEVISDVISLYPNAAHDLILWGHGMSWTPYFSDHTIKNNVIERAFGGEYNSSGFATDWTDLDELASAIPDNVFEIIWFDACYMSSIEVIYQFRNKCQSFVAYPTEVWQYGVPYDLVLPYLMKSNPDLHAAASAFYEYYNRYGSPVTVAVVDMSKVEYVAQSASSILHSGDARPLPSELLNYSRTKSAPYYDFRQYLEKTANANESSHLITQLDEALQLMVTFHAESQRNFDLVGWNVNSISGVSVHDFHDNGSAQEEYYKTLDWYRRVY